MAKSQSDNISTPDRIENRLRQRRQAAGLSQKQLAGLAGITRQAVAAVETNQYSPATSVALQLARALQCRVEDLFSIEQAEDVLDGDLVTSLPRSRDSLRAQVAQVGGRVLVRPLGGTGALNSLTGCADGLIVQADAKSRRVKVKLLKDRQEVRNQILLGGCDPAMFLAAEQLRKQHRTSLVPYLMGNDSALAALRRGEVHVAGVHMADRRNGAWASAGFQSVLRALDCTVFTFAHWEEGIIVRQGNPKKLRSIEDLARPKVRIVNRERGSGARRLLDRELLSAGLSPARVKGYDDEVLSHLDVAARVEAGFADAGVGLRAAASICGLDFVPLQRERYDLLIPKSFFQTLEGIQMLLNLMVSRRFREELEAFGGYDTRDTGKLVELGG